MQAMENSLSSLMQRIGVSRLANQTGLDRVGYPVFAAIRPQSRNLSVSFGKGATAEQAKISAVMEAAELYFSETAPTPLRNARYTDLASATALDPSTLKPANPDLDLRAEDLEWVTGYELSSRRPLLVPWQVISMDYTAKAREQARQLQFGATGLAADFDETRAILHGLCEVVERDCHSAWNSLGDEERVATLVDNDSCEWSEIGSLREMIRHASLEVLIWNMTGSNHIPCYLAEIFDQAPNATTAYVQGSAASWSPQLAIQKAVSEALQVRLTYIAGSRDDLDWCDYGERYNDIVESRCWIKEQAFPRQKITAKNNDTIDTSLALRTAVDHLQLSGVNDIAVVRLSPRDEPVAVVKVVVPEMCDTPDVDDFLSARTDNQPVHA
jgi:YcaO-like protein with predicted kinase domain